MKTIRRAMSRWLQQVNYGQWFCFKTRSLGYQGLEWKAQCDQAWPACIQLKK